MHPAKECLIEEKKDIVNNTSNFAIYNFTTLNFSGKKRFSSVMI